MSECYQAQLLKSIAKAAFDGMEGCDEPYFTALSAILNIASDPDAYYDRETNLMREVVE